MLAMGPRDLNSFFFLLPAPHKFEVQSLAMNKGEALIGRLPSISLAAATITTGFVQVMHIHQGCLWGQVIPQVGRQRCADVLCHGQCQPSSRDLNSAPYSPVHCSSHSMTSFQSSELTELPVVENKQLFAQRAHSARYAPIRYLIILDGQNIKKISFRNFHF